MLRTLEISSSGLVAQRLRMDTIAGNIANSHTTLNEQGQPEPFHRRLVVLEAAAEQSKAIRGLGVQAQVEVDEKSLPRIIHDPGHPHADAEGNVKYPNINVITEFVNALEAARAYEANLTAMQVSRSMIEGTFQILG
ncbi:flagellar basal body rod protein FlgC [bacterium]|nr:flagellar basal body rod protein FlgC [bacterium]